MKKDKKHGNLDSDGYERGYGLLRYLTMTALQSKHFALKNRFPALADRFLCVRGFPPSPSPPSLSHAFASVKVIIIGHSHQAQQPTGFK